MASVRQMASQVKKHGAKNASWLCFWRDLNGRQRSKAFGAGIAAKQHLESLLELYGLSEVRTHKDRTGKYGRMLATLIGVHGDELIDLNQRMIDDGHAEPM